MSENYLKKEQAKSNLKASTPLINFVKEKLTALVILVCLVSLIYIGSDTKEPEPPTPPKDLTDVIQDTGKEKRKIMRGETDDVNGESELNESDTTAIEKDEVNSELNEVTLKSPNENKQKVETRTDRNSETRIKTVQVNLSVSGNLVTWNRKLIEAAEQIKISFVDEKRRTWVPKGNSSGNVTGKNSFTYNPMDGRAGNIATTVELFIVLKDGYKLEGKTILKDQYFECSDTGD